MRIRFCDETEHGFGWIVEEFLQRCSHALVLGGRVWLIDPVDADGVEERLRAAGDVAGVVQLLDRHERDCAAFAERFGVDHHVVPRAAIDGAPFEFRDVKSGRTWDEVALWWPDPAVLVCGDAVGTLPEYRAAGDRLALHPLLRLTPPRRSLGGLEPRHVLCGHGEGLRGDDAAPALREALATARRRLPQAWWRGLRGAIRSRRK